MTTAVWLLQNNFIDQSQIEIVAKAIVECGGEVVYVRVIPFSDQLQLVDTENESLKFGGDVVPYGSTKLTKLSILGEFGGVFFNDNFNTEVWNLHRDDMLNVDCNVMRVKDTAEILKDVRDDLPMFIRPCLDLKSFNGTLTTVREIKRWAESPDSGNFSFDEDTKVSIASAKNIKAEWRWFIVNGKVIDGSVYRLRGQKLTIHEINEDVIAEAQMLADKWLPHHTCVMDTAEIDNSEMKVIEFNCLNSSGFYNHDIPKVVKAVTDMMSRT